MSNSEIKSQVRWLYAVGILLALIGTIVTYMTFKVLSRSITDPYELALLNQRNAEYFALQSQIQPHFLYNTLNGFIALNRMGEKKLLENGIIALTKMMRYVLGKQTHEQVEDEFKYLERYLELQKLRFDQRLHYEIHLDEDIKTLKIPKLLLQPLVENAVIHGLEPLDRTVHLVIRGEQMVNEGKSFITFIVADDGAGFDAEAFNLSESVGLANVRERLKLSYGNSCFEIESQKGEGTKVIIRIPVEALNVKNCNC